MPTLSVTTTTEITIKPSLQTKLRKEFKAYGEQKLIKDVAEEKMDKHKKAIGEVRDEIGEQSITLDGYTDTLVAPIRKKFNPKKFVALGGDLAIYNQAVEDVPSKAYEKISCPGAKTDDE